VTLWEIDIHPREGQPDLLGNHVAAEAKEAGISHAIRVVAAHSYLVQGSLTDPASQKQLTRLLADSVNAPDPT
jgi:hypothetical protein